MTHRESYAHPRHLCDLVMKGGITSGVVYPLAVCELAKVYSFKNIGGTSAGAIAAAAAAAAECGRRGRSADAGGFQRLALLPDWIGKPGRLVEMFRPDRRTRTLFAILMAAMNPKTAIGKVTAVAGQLLIRFPLIVLAIVALVWAVLRWPLAGVTGFAFVYALTATIVLALVLFLAAVLVFIYREITRTLPENFYGMSRAYDAGSGIDDADAPLTNWLTRYLNELAGKPLSSGPLTFGDLYTAPRPPDDPEPEGPDYKAINLEMMTTSVSHGRPYRLPFRDPDRIFYFCADDFGKLFPPIVVDHMTKHAPERQGMPPYASGCDRLYPFPDPRDVPVVVATRMSLSFPVLLSAIPLYAVDYTLDENHDQTRAPRAERCWFSDGGICSNLPIHFFDAPLPLWPTFAINLKQFHPDHQEESDAVWLPPNQNSGWLPVWTRFEQPGGYGPLSSFLWAILDTMQNWQDTTQARVPGYRDRLVHVSQRNDEGGLNLNMPRAVITRLSDRGARAGAALVQRFGDPSETVPAGWTEHRWVRFRSCMELTFEWIRRIAKAYTHPISPEPTLEQVLLRPPGTPPSSYPLQPADQRRAKEAMDGLLEASADWDRNGTGLESNAPRPRPELRVKPRV